MRFETIDFDFRAKYIENEEDNTFFSDTYSSMVTCVKPLI